MPKICSQQNKCTQKLKSRYRYFGIGIREIFNVLPGHVKLLPSIAHIRREYELAMLIPNIFRRK